MANICPSLRVGFPARHTLSIDYATDNYTQTYSVVYTGTTNDTNNLDIADYTEWDSSKTDYTIGTYVKIVALGIGAICGVADTRVHPMEETADWKTFTLKEFAPFDGSPTRKGEKSYVDDENLEFTLNFSRTTNLLFVHNMENIQSVKVESLDENGDVIEILDETDLVTFLQFEMCNPCPSVWDYKENYNLSFNPCGEYSKIKISLIPIENKKAYVGVVAVSSSYNMGRLTAFVTTDGESTTKTKPNLADNNLDIKEGYSLDNFNVKIDMKDELIPMNLMDRLMRKNASKINFYSFGFDDIDSSNVVGFHTVPSSQVGGLYEIPMSVKIYTMR